MRSEIEELASALYRLQWDADLYATPRGHETKRYERRAKKLLSAGYYKRDVGRLADWEVTMDVLADHHIDHRYDTVLHEQCTCGRRWMVGPGKLEAHHAEVQSVPARTPSAATVCATCDGGGCGDCV